MVIASLGGGSPTACALLGRQGRAHSLHAAALRVGLHGHRKQSCISGGECDRHASSHARRAYTLTSDTAVSGPDVRSADLNDMCTLQLGMLYQLLSRAGVNYSSMRCTVYARNFTSVGPGQVKLVRVAQFPVSPGHNDDLQSQQQLLLHTEQSWALQGGAAAVDPSAMIEDCLRHREVVALPSSSSLVFPMVDCAVLVGLLVVELEADRPPLGVGAGVGGVASGSGGAAAGPAGLGLGAAGPALPPALACTEGLRAGGDAAGGDGGGGGVPAVAAGSTSLELGSCQVQARPRRSLTDEELQCLRLAVPLLAKACGMDARSSWQLVQSSLSAATVRGLLREAQRPLSTLNTFGAMLLPRLKDGDPDKDMAKGILVQGKRLQDLMWQLEDALHGPGAVGGMGPNEAAAQPSTSVAMPGMGATQHGTTPPAPPFRSPSALPRDPSPAIQELLSLPPPRLAALPAAPQQPHQQPPLPDFRDAASPTSTAAPAEGGPPAVLPGRVTFVDRSSSDALATSASMDRVTDAFTIRQPSSQPPPVSASGRSPPSGLGPVVAAGMRPGGAAAAASQLPAHHGASTATIDVEMDGCDARKPSLALSERSCSWGPSYVSGAGGHLAAAVSTTNLASALAGVLTAAYRLAAVSGIGFIVNSPLSAVLPRRSTGASTGKLRTHAATAAGGQRGSGGKDAARKSARQENAATAAAGSEDGDPSLAVAPGPRLIPRPARPLLVGVHASLMQKVVGYMLDIALQCTPRGGQVCVSARQDGAGVQVQVLHSGRMDLQRLHVRSRSMAHPGHGHAAPSAFGAAAPAAPPVGPRGVAAPHGGGGATVAVATRSAVGSVAAVVSPAGSGGAHAGSGVLSVEIAQELAQQAGGHLTVSYPCNMVNAQNGSLDAGTSVEIWLPGPGGAPN